MSNVSQFGLFKWAIAMLRRARFGSRTAPEFAHPWSAFRAPTYLAGAAPEGIVLATRAGLLVGDLSGTRINVAIDLPSLESKELPSATFDDAKSTRRPAKLRLVKSDPIAPPLLHPVQSNQEYRLAARLRSVSVLNRPCRYSTRLLQNTLASKPRRTNEPRMILRRNREPAEVVNLAVLSEQNQGRKMQFAA